MKKLTLLVMVFCALPGFSAAANAEVVTSQAQVIHIRGVVPQMRVLYVKDAQLIKIGGNTTKNVTPTALDVSTNQATEVTSALLNQYQTFLAIHGNRLEPGYYTVPHTSLAQTSKPKQALNLGDLRLSV